MLRCCSLTSVLLGGLIGTAAAQGGGPRALTDSTVIEQRVTDLSERLSLSLEQTASIRTILHEEAALARKAMQEAEGDRDAVRRAFRDRAQVSDRRIEELLTEEQREAYRKHRDERRREMRQRFQEGERPKP